MKKNRLDYEIICKIIKPESRVLDLGCGDGELLKLLVEKKRAVVQGIELNEEEIYKCVEKGVSVFHGDFEGGLTGYPDRSFDCVILNQSMQEARNIEKVISEALRVGGKVIVGFPNFAHINARIRLFLWGKTPITRSLPYRWYSTPNLHFLSLTDFVDYCRVNQIEILERHYLGKEKEIFILPNLVALDGIYLIQKAESR